MKHDPVSAFDNDNIIEGIPLSSYQMLKLVEERGGVGFWSLEIATRGLWGSPGFHRVTGLPATDDLRGLFRRLIHPDDQAAQADLWDLIQLGHVVDREFRIIRPDQTVRWVALKTGVVLGPDALPARTDGVLLDTTATHEARQIAAWMQGRQTGVLRAITAATWSAHPAGEIEMAAGWERLTGQTATEMAGFGWLNALHPDDRRVALAAWQAARTTGAPYRAEYRVRGADGTYRRFSSRGAAQAGPDGAVREWFGLVLAVPDDARDAVPDAAIGPLIRGGGRSSAGRSRTSPRPRGSRAPASGGWRSSARARVRRSARPCARPSRAPASSSPRSAPTASPSRSIPGASRQLRARAAEVGTGSSRIRPQNRPPDRGAMPALGPGRRPAPGSRCRPFVNVGSASISAPKPLRVSNSTAGAAVMTILSVICLVTGATLAGIAPKRSVQQAALESAGGSLIVLGLVIIGAGLPLFG